MPLIMKQAYAQKAREEKLRRQQMGRKQSLWTRVYKLAREQALRKVRFFLEFNACCCNNFEYSEPKPKPMSKPKDKHKLKPKLKPKPKPKPKHKTNHKPRPKPEPKPSP